MADVGTAIREYLQGVTAVTALVSTRIHPDALPQGCTMPAIAYTKISTVDDQIITGAMSMSSCRIEFECFGATRARSNAVASAIRLSGLPTLRGTQSSVFIHAVESDSGPQTYPEYPTDGSDVRRYVTVIDYLVHYQES